ncbi:MAG: HEPN domain-containing protein [Anaerolineaceae bacterium]|nr:HEPN domain-containing protein [Anaerolineaceae bacterium]
MPSPRQTFEDNIRPAELLLRVYLMLDTNDRLLTEGQIVDSLRPIVDKEKGDDLVLVYNELFLGLILNEEQIPRSTLRRSTLCHLLRQAIVASCTALDTYLPALLRTNLPIVIRVVGRDFVPRDDAGVAEYLQGLTFSIDETLRLINDTNAAEYISNKILGLSNFSYLSSRKGAHVVCRLLGLSKPWGQIADHLNRDKKDLMNLLDEAVRRRNDIVHRADRCQENPDGDAQEITYSWTRQAVDTLHHICLAMDELVIEKINEYQATLI